MTLPGDFAEGGGRVVWTLRNRDVVHSVPGRIGVDAYELHFRPMAMGSLPPVLRMGEDGPELWGVMTHPGDPREGWQDDPPSGSIADPLRMSATVGEPLELEVWVTDRLAPGAERERVDGGATWYNHVGPALAQFSPEDPELDLAAGGRATTTVRFPEPGEYLLRVRADNFNPVDSSPETSVAGRTGTWPSQCRPESTGTGPRLPGPRLTVRPARWSELRTGERGGHYHRYPGVFPESDPTQRT